MGSLRHGPSLRTARSARPGRKAADCAPIPDPAGPRRSYDFIMGKHTVKARSLEPGDLVEGLRLTEVREDEHERGTVKVTGRVVGQGRRETRFWPGNRLIEVERQD